MNSGLFGKLPAHGDFVRRNLPAGFVGAWDAWLQAVLPLAQERLGDRLEELWDTAPPWRFLLPGGLCGPDPATGVMLFSADRVGRRFPLALACVGDAAPPENTWYDALERLGLTALREAMSADVLAAELPAPAGQSYAAAGWWQGQGGLLADARLPSAARLCAMLEDAG